MAVNIRCTLNEWWILLFHFSLLLLRRFINKWCICYHTFRFVHFPSFTDDTTYIDSNFKHCKWDNYFLVRIVSQISTNNITIFNSSIYFAKDLGHKLRDCRFSIPKMSCKWISFDRLGYISIKWRSYWSVVLNCQIFTLSTVKDLDCTLPSDVKICKWLCSNNEEYLFQFFFIIKR